MPSPEKLERNKRLAKLRSKGWTFQALAKEFNIKRPTAYKIFKRYNKDKAVDKVLT